MGYQSPYKKGYRDGYDKGHNTGYWKGQRMDPAADRFWAAVTIATFVIAFVIALEILANR